jgi:hypothetical protein
MRFGHPLAARSLKHSILGELRGVGIGADGHRDDACPRGFRRAASRLSIAAAGEQATLTQLAVRLLRGLTFELSGRHRQGSWAARRMIFLTASRPKGLVGGGPLERKVRRHRGLRSVGQAKCCSRCGR